MATKNLINEQNQKTYNQWVELRQQNRPEHTTQEAYQKSINQYKSAIIALDDSLCCESFEALTIEILNEAYEATPKKKNHINAFLKDIFILGIDIDKQVMLSLYHGIDNQVINKLLGN